MLNSVPLGKGFGVGGPTIPVASVLAALVILGAVVGSHPLFVVKIVLQMRRFLFSKLQII